MSLLPSFQNEQFGVLKNCSILGSENRTMWATHGPKQPYSLRTPLVKDLDLFIAKRKVCAELLEIIEKSNPFRVLGVQDQCESGGFEPHS